MRLFGYEFGRGAAAPGAQAHPGARPSGARFGRAWLAAAVDRLTASWLAEAKAINDELRADLDKLRARARDLAKNNDYARRFLRMVRRNVVGAQGVILQARVEERPGQPDRLANNAIEAAFARWAKRGSAEITGRLSFADLQRAVVQAVARDGEALVRLVRGKDARNPEGFALQHLDIARLDTTRNLAPAAGRNAIVMGIELDTYSRPVAYWLKARADASTSSAVRIPAGDILHIFIPEEAEQVRGIPWMHAAMLAMHDLGEFNRSALLAARKGANTLGFIVSPDGTANALGDETVEGEPIKISAPGSYDVLPEGYDIRTPESPYPNTVYEPFTKAIVRRIAAGLDVANHNLSGDMTEVNYSSARIAELGERDEWVTLQNWFIEAFLEPVYAEWFARAMTAGTLTMPNGSALPVSKADKFFAHEWQGRRWQWVDPQKDIEAARLAIKSGIASPQMIAAQNGVDIEDVIASIAAFEAMVASSKVTLVDYELSTPSTAAPTADQQARQLGELKELHQRALEGIKEALRAPAAAAPATTINLDSRVLDEAAQRMADAAVQGYQTVVETIGKELRDMQVNITPEINFAPAISVEPTPVQLEARIDVKPADVNVHLPPRRTETSIVRDAGGHIVAASQVETDA